MESGCASLFSGSGVASEYPSITCSIDNHYEIDGFISGNGGNGGTSFGLGDIIKFHYDFSTDVVHWFKNDIQQVDVHHIFFFFCMILYDFVRSEFYCIDKFYCNY